MIHNDFQSGNVTLTRVSAGMFSSIDRLDDSLVQSVSNMSENDEFTAQGLLKLQKIVNEWTISVEMASSVLKSFGDVMKNILQKM